jgi:hypothetical protein
MRVGTVHLLFVAAAIFVRPQAALAEPAVLAESVAAIIASPGTYSDKSVVISGVMIPGWRLCDEPFGKSEGEANYFGAKACIDVVDHGRKLTTQEEKYNGARVTMTGVYWNRCLPEVRSAEPEIVRDICEREGANGWIGPTRVAIAGYTVLQMADGGENSAALSAVAKSHEVDELARRFVGATRARSISGIAELYALPDRGRLRVTLTKQETRDHWVHLSPEMARLGEGASTAGFGYRHFRTSSSAGPTGPTALCFCRKPNCEGQWPTTREDIDRPQNLATPFVCHASTYADGRWYLD